MIAGSLATKDSEIDDVKGADVIGFALEVLEPVALAPEAKAVHLASIGAEGRVGVGRAFEIERHQVDEVAAHDLIGVDLIFFKVNCFHKKK